MTFHLARLSPLVVGLFFGIALVGEAQSILSKDSPFLPIVSISTSAAPGETHELAAFATIGGATAVNIYDRAIKKGRWIPVGSAVDGIVVVNFDEQRQQAVVRVAGAEKVLHLRKASGPSVAPAGISARPNFPFPSAVAPTR